MNNSIIFSGLSRNRIIAGILLAIIVAFAFYALSCIGRESLRYLSITDDYDLWVLSDREVNFYNLISAFIAVIIAQSTFITFLFDRPGKLFEKKHYLRTSIINDQRFLNLSFIHWFVKIAFIIALFYGITVPGGFYVFNLYPSCNYIFILLIIVLFLQTWVTIRRKFKRKSIKWVFISAITLSLFAFILSRINFIDYKAINQICLQKNIIYTYNINLPESDWTEIENRDFKEKRIYLVNENSEPILIIDNEKIKIEKINEAIFRSYDDIEIIETLMQTYKLVISQEQKMEAVNKLKAELSKAGIRRIAYAVIPSRIKYDKRYYRDSEIRLFLPYTTSENFIDHYNDAHLFENIIEIETSDNKNFIVNKRLLSDKNLKLHLKRIIIENPDYIFKYNIKDNNTFSEYIKTYSFLKETIQELREDYSINKYKMGYTLLDEHIKIKINEKYPFRIIEITEDSINLIMKVQYN